MISPAHECSTVMEHDQHYGQVPYLHSDGQWGDHSGCHSHHASPIHEYTGYTFSSPPLSLDSTFSAHPHHATVGRSAHHQQLQPLVVPQWPSLIASQGSYNQQQQSTPAPASAPTPSTHVNPPQILPAPTTAPPHLPSSSPVHHTPTPRKTLTDADRRRMCLYHEEHPTKKQTEIGELFGVERSTVSKVLRQKDKYLQQDEGSRSPVKRSKGKFPDIERALTNWAKNQEQKGFRLTDDMIREQAKFFSATVPGGAEMAAKMNSSSWLEKFKQKNNLMGFRARKGSNAAADTSGSAPGSNGATLSPTILSRTTSPTTSPLEMVSAKSPDSAADDKSRMHIPFQSQSNTSLSSAFTEATGSTFSTANTSSNSPLFSPGAVVENGTTHFFQGSSMTSRAGAMPAPAPTMHRPRSQTFPSVSAEPYLSPPHSTQDPVTPKFSTTTSPLLTSPLSDLHNSETASTRAPRDMSVTEATFTYPDYQQNDHKHNQDQAYTETTSTRRYQSSPSEFFSTLTFSPDVCLQNPSREDARRALELFLTYAQNQPASSGLVEPGEYVTIGKLMARLRVHSDAGSAYSHQHQQQPGHGSPRASIDAPSRNGSLSLSRSGSLGGSVAATTDAELPGGLHRIPEHEFGANGGGGGD